MALAVPTSLCRDDDVIEFIVKQEVPTILHTLMPTLGRASPDFLIAALRVVGNIFSGPQEFIDMLGPLVPELLKTIAGVLDSREEGAV